MVVQGFSRGFLLCLGLGCACGPKEEDTTMSGGTDGTGMMDTGGDELPTGGDTEPQEPGGSVAISASREVDLLFVIDNSGSMAEEQALLSSNMAALIGVLEAPDVRADYRIGVTTTDSGNPRCPSAVTTPEGGNLVLSSCVDRVDQGEFEFNADDFSFACTDFCGKRDSDLQVLGTATAVDPNKVPRKWVERSGGALNIGGVADAVEALQCYLPQGVAGCGFESHLESMYLALAGSQSQQSKNNYGFLRETAQLAVVIVSDETDCSYSPAFKEIFTTNKVFWNDPNNDAAPSSAMCWRAGVACSGGPGVFSECHAENFDDNGEPGAADEQAVLQPVGKYVDFVKNIEQQKQQIDERQRVKVSLVTGVPQGYEQFAAEIPYEDTPDENYQLNFGIGPGCVLGDVNFPETAAVPPVRERAFAEAFAEADERRLYSICQDSYAAALQAIGDEIADGISPSCMPVCVADTEPNSPILEPSCTVTETNLIEGVDTPLAQCLEVGGAWQPPNGAQACYASLVDSSGSLTPSKLDDMSAACVLEGFNLEFAIVRAVPAKPGTVVSAKCELSANKAVECPNL